MDQRPKTNPQIARKEELLNLIRAMEKAGASETDVRRTFEKLITEVFRG